MSVNFCDSRAVRSASLAYLVKIGRISAEEAEILEKNADFVQSLKFQVVLPSLGSEAVVLPQCLGSDAKTVTDTSPIPRELLDCDTVSTTEFRLGTTGNVAAGENSTGETVTTENGSTTEKTAPYQKTTEKIVKTLEAPKLDSKALRRQRVASNKQQKAKKRRKADFSVAEELVVLNKPFDVRLDLPVARDIARRGTGSDSKDTEKDTEKDTSANLRKAEYSEKDTEKGTEKDTEKSEITNAESSGGDINLGSANYRGSTSRKFPEEVTVQDWFGWYTRKDTESSCTDGQKDSTNNQSSCIEEENTGGDGKNSCTDRQEKSCTEKTKNTTLEVKSPTVTMRFCNQLDNATSGILLMALSKRAAGLISSQLADRRSIKIYEAIVVGHLDLFPGCPQNGSGLTNGIGNLTSPQNGIGHLTIEKPIRDISMGSFMRTCSPQFESAKTEENGHTPPWQTAKTETPPWQSAKTEVFSTQHGYFNGDKNMPVTFVKIRIFTGRRHQIRVHLLHEGHPILGDMVYNEENRRKYEDVDITPDGGTCNATNVSRGPPDIYRMFLHSASIEFPDLDLKYEAGSGFERHVLS